jgi:ribosome-interacting GTPase 1
MQIIRRRLTGKDGSERVRELRAILADLPNYRNGPYADIPKWVMDQIDQTRVRSRVVQRDSIAVRVGVSVIDDASLETFREAVWRLTGLIRVYLRHDGDVAEEPIALEPGATVAEVAATIHRSLGGSFRSARIWGPSARFDGQQVGRDQSVQDGDVVQILS